MRERPVLPPERGEFSLAHPLRTAPRACCGQGLLGSVRSHVRPPCCLESTPRVTTIHGEAPMKTLRPRKRPIPSRPGIEALEARLMLDGAAASSLPALVVGRTLSASSVDAVRNNQVAITYTVSNEQADPETGVLLTTTLAPGVTFAGASAEPLRLGQDLSWSLGTLQAYARASVTLTVNLATP